jgi:hypothetical protein
MTIGPNGQYLGTGRPSSVLYRGIWPMRPAPFALILLAACATPAAPPQVMRAPDYSAREIRQPALFVHVRDHPDLTDRERKALADTYEGALIEAFDTRGFPPSDVQRVAPGAKFEMRLALARAREIRADYAIVVELRVERREAIFCRGSRRPFQLLATVWTQGVQVLRVRDGAARVAIAPGQGLDIEEFEPDCANPRKSRLRDRAEMIASAVEAVTDRVLGR